MAKMRRSDRQTDRATANALLAACEHGVLSTVDSPGQPYGVPVNYAFDGQAIYLHSAPEFVDEGERYIEQHLDTVRVTKIAVDDVSGKARS